MAPFMQARKNFGVSAWQYKAACMHGTTLPPALCIAAGLHAAGLAGSTQYFTTTNYCVHASGKAGCCDPLLRLSWAKAQRRNSHICRIPLKWDCNCWQLHEQEDECRLRSSHTLNPKPQAEGQGQTGACTPLAMAAVCAVYCGCQELLHGQKPSASRRFDCMQAAPSQHRNG